MDNVEGITLAALTVLLLGLVATALLLAAAYGVRRIRGIPSPAPEPDSAAHARRPDPLVLLGAAVIVIGLAVVAWGLLGDAAP